MLLLEAFPFSLRVGLAMHCTSKMEHTFGEAQGSEAKLRAPLQPPCTRLGSVSSALWDQGSAGMPGACGSLLIKTTQAVRKVFIRASISPGPEEKDLQYRCPGVQPVLETVTPQERPSQKHRPRAKAETPQGTRCLLGCCISIRGSSIQGFLCCVPPAPCPRPCLGRSR